VNSFWGPYGERGKILENVGKGRLKETNNKRPNVTRSSWGRCPSKIARGEKSGGRARVPALNLSRKSLVRIPGKTLGTLPGEANAGKRVEDAEARERVPGYKEKRGLKGHNRIGPGETKNRPNYHERIQ